MKQQTALEWFMYKVDECENTDDFLDAYNKAKEMEKEQIINAHGNQYRGGFRSNGDFFEQKVTGEEYYNETYNQK
jgi:hypothetical protein